MSDSPPLRRILLWSFLAVAILTVAATFFLSKRGAGEDGAGHELPPVLDTLPDFTLSRADGGTTRLADLVGKPWVANFIFTRCHGNCPRLTEEMSNLVDPREESGTTVGRVSFTVDPEHDRPEVLAQYVRTRGITDEEWLFLTGDPEEMRTLFVEGFKLGFGGPQEPASAVEPIIHTTRFVLVDDEARIRGYYDVFEPEDRARLRSDLEALRAARGG